MVIRKIRTSHTKIIKAFFFCITILLIIIHLINIRTGDKPEPMEGITIINELEKNNQIYIQGNIQTSENFPLYTHVITTSGGEQFGLKSININLKTLTGVVSVYGTITDNNRGLNILNVEKILQDHIIIDNRKYILLDKKISIDLSSILGSSIDIQDHEITINYENYPISSVSFIDCQNNPNNEFCLIEYKRDNPRITKSFISLRGYDIFQVDNHTRILPHGTRYLFIIDSDSEQELIDIAHVFRPIDTKYILSLYQKTITEYCENIVGIKTPSASYVDFDNTIIYYIEEGLDSSQRKKTCTIGFDARYSHTNPIVSKK